MTEPTTAEPAFGVKTCAKPAPPPVEFLGPCLHDIGHEGKCRYKAPPLPQGGYVEITIDEDESPLLRDPAVVKYRAMLRRQARVSLVCCVVVFACAAYNLLSVFGVL